MFELAVSFFLAIGIYMILADYLKLPTIRTSKAIKNVIKRNFNKTNKLEIYLDDLAGFISRYIKINEYKKQQLKVDLVSAGQEITPELYLSKAIVKALLCIIIGIPICILVPIFTPIIFICTFVIYTQNTKNLQKKINQKRNEIEYELPRLVNTIERTITHNRDVLSLLQNYRSHAGQQLQSELNVAIADMKSSNYEAALVRMETRIGSTMMSDVIRGLISIIRGDETKSYWTALEIKFTDIQRQLLKRKAQRIPPKIKRLSMIMLFCFIATYFVIMGTVIIQSLGVMFG